MSFDPEAITLRETARGGRYVYPLDGQEADLTFANQGDTRVIDHTGVPRAFEGRGIGAALVLRAVTDARAAGKKVLPLCSFAAAQFRRHPEWSDLLEA